MNDITLLYKQRIFSKKDVMNIMSINSTSAAESLLRWQRKGIVKLIRKNMYTVIDMATNTPLADKYEIASNISPTSYVGWHTALEYHGLAHQMFFSLYVGSESKFNGFTFEDIEYVYQSAPLKASENCGVVRPDGNPLMRVTDLERTIVDCCHRIERAGGAEELMHCMEGIVLLDEKKLKKYLSLYDTASLYQKTGFMLERIKDQAHISNSLIQLCMKKGTKSVKKLSRDSTVYVRSWNLYVPDYLLTHKPETDDIV